MKLHVLYFARLREALNCADETLTVPPTVTTVGELRDYLMQEQGHGALGEITALRCAVNQELADFGKRLRSGDEVAFFPPVTGG